MSRPDRPSQLPEASRARARRSRERRYKAAGAGWQCGACLAWLPTRKGRTIHQTTRHGIGGKP